MKYLANLKNFNIILAFLVMFLFSVSSIFAQGNEADGESVLQESASEILGYIIGFGFVVATIMAPYIGYLLASGDPSRIQRGRELLQSLIQGLILLALSATVVSVVGSDILSL